MIASLDLISINKSKVDCCLSDSWEGQAVVTVWQEGPSHYSGLRFRGKTFLKGVQNRDKNERGEEEKLHSCSRVHRGTQGPQ